MQERAKIEKGWQTRKGKNWKGQASKKTKLVQKQLCLPRNFRKIANFEILELGTTLSKANVFVAFLQYLSKEKATSKISIDVLKLPEVF